MTRSRKPKPQQLEVAWPETEAFTLITQSAVDGDRVSKEASQRAVDQPASEKHQTELLSNPIQPT